MENEPNKVGKVLVVVVKKWKFHMTFVLLLCKIKISKLISKSYWNTYMILTDSLWTFITFGIALWLNI